MDLKDEAVGGGMTKRDPRIYPRPGDVAIDQWGEYNVVTYADEACDRVETLAIGQTGHQTDAMTFETWRRDTTEVIHVAD